MSGYVAFINEVRKGKSLGLELAEAVTEAVKYCEERRILQPFLSDHASEVLNMLTTEFRMEDAIAVWKEEGREEGREEGIKKGREEGIVKGREEGIVKGREEGIKKLTKLLQEGIPLDAALEKAKKWAQ